MIGLVEVGMLYIIFTFPETENTNSIVKNLLLVFLVLIFFTVGRELYHSIMRKNFEHIKKKLKSWRFCSGFFLYDW